jgi:hypothetical protein
MTRTFNYTRMPHIRGHFARAEVGCADVN